jgi:hypothetical protein
VSVLLADWIGEDVCGIKPAFFSYAGEFQRIFVLVSASFYQVKLSMKC